MPDAFHAEFTGERVIPGRVEDNLFNEHLARYRFAARLARELGIGGRFLDAGCGAGYGAAELAKSGAEVLAIDVSDEAIAHARANYAASDVRFEQASCTAIPAEDGAFGLIAAFEVIEHLDGWREFLEEARRVLGPAGLFLVSTPNRLYYAESRKKAGPNPFHVHEFTEEEFRSELAAIFPYVKVLLQNHVEGVAFSGADADGMAFEVSEQAGDPSSAHFFLAVCGEQPLPSIARFVFIPETGNVLQTRERHIALLDGEIRQKNEWIESEKVQRGLMIGKVRELEAELEEHNRWARQANEEAERRARLVAELQDELRKSNEWAQVRDAEAVARGKIVAELQEELKRSNEWAQRRDADAVERGQRVEQLQTELERSNEWAKLRDAEAVERSRRVQQLQGEVAQATAWAKAREAEAEERGQRIVELQAELAQATTWALGREAEAEERGQRVIELQTELAQATEWARNRDSDAEARGVRIVELQDELQREQEGNLASAKAMQAEQDRIERELTAASAGYEAAIDQWRREKEASDRWAMETERRLSGERDAAREAFAGKQMEYESALERMALLQADMERLRGQLTEANTRMDMIAQSRWVRLGRAVRVGPDHSSDMNSALRSTATTLGNLALLLVSPILILAIALALALADLAFLLAGRRKRPADRMPDASAASVVIPNWNGRDLLAKYIPPLIEALAANPANEIVVVDNGSEDGSAEFLREQFPQVRVVELVRNLGFGGGSNAGFREARNDIVVLLNSDMRVDSGFLAPLLKGFTDDKIFAVSCQIFLSDPEKRREETGLTEGWWEDGCLRVSHREDSQIDRLYPCFYGGGGSCAFDRRKFLELGGFDELLAPFYLEDTDIGYMAWKRGWKVLYQPASKVWHEHRGTIGRKFSQEYIDSVLKKNFLLFVWKNIHNWRRVAEHLIFSWSGATFSLLVESPERTTYAGMWRAFRQLPGALASRWSARSLAVIGDTEAFRRPQGGYFRDRFLPPPEPNGRLRVAFASPYPICPPVHGGGFFMYGTIVELARSCEVHALINMEYPYQMEAHEVLKGICASVTTPYCQPYAPPEPASILPFAIREFREREMAHQLNRIIYLKQIDVVQLEYTVFGQYAGDYRHVVCALFEHDVSFQAIARGYRFIRQPLVRVKATWEYLRMIRYELALLRKFHVVQVCTRENRLYLESFAPSLRGRIQEGLRAGIDASQYAYPGPARRPYTLLFLGNFRHLPNVTAMQWFCQESLPRIVERYPQTRVIVAGADPPPMHAFIGPGGNSAGVIELPGYIADIRPLLASSAVFICPVRSGSGVRVKLLEAFASGIPVVSTYIGAEGLARKDGEICFLADDPAEFADRVVELFDNPGKGAELARAAREEVMANWDMRAITEKLVASYREALRKNGAQGVMPEREAARAMEL